MNIFQMKKKCGKCVKIPKEKEKRVNYT